MEKDSKVKLRTSEDVYNRLKWEGMYDTATIWIGYEDRFEGPMEIAFDSFEPMALGCDGQIPYHRVWYFRTTELDAPNDGILWDRRRRYDVVFKSGETIRLEQLQQKVERHGVSKADSECWSRDCELLDETRAAVTKAWLNAETEEDKQRMRPYGPLRWEQRTEEEEERTEEEEEGEMEHAAVGGDEAVQQEVAVDA
eukprot:GDKI01021186.1.p1 GENE.GDKI01021186.1~~GDKI01021186.1.p1  ORF type:complete len:222 (+),score=62.76 GDKI01021186.1:78-668(+)